MPAKMLAEKINTSPQNLNALFKRESIDTEQLLAIANALNYDFFALFSKELEESNEKVKEAKERAKWKSDVNEIVGAQPDIGTVAEHDFFSPKDEELSTLRSDLKSCRSSMEKLNEMFALQTKNAVQQDKYIKMLEEKLATVEADKRG